MEMPLVVVSGLPRSGTSLMMSALEAGGLPLIQDAARPADPHNPRGYFEDQRVRDLATEATWLAGQAGKGVKILSHLLVAIPPEVRARVIVMRRPLEQVLASQNAMLGQSGTPPELAELIARDFAATLRWLRVQPHLTALEVSYLELVEEPERAFRRVADFLGGSWDVAAMAAVVDRRLHRQRGS